MTARLKDSEAIRNRPVVQNKNRKASAIDRTIGTYLDTARIEAGVSHAVLASAMKVSFQQVSKYLNGTNRLAVARLPQIAKVLGRQTVIDLVNKITGA